MRQPDAIRGTLVNYEPYVHLGDLADAIEDCYTGSKQTVPGLVADLRAFAERERRPRKWWQFWRGTVGRGG